MKNLYKVAAISAIVIVGLIALISLHTKQNLQAPAPPVRIVDSAIPLRGATNAHKNESISAKQSIEYNDNNKIVDEQKIKSTLFGYLGHGNDVGISCSEELCTVSLSPQDNSLQMKNAAMVIQISAGLKDKELEAIGYRVAKQQITTINQNGEPILKLIKIKNAA